MPKRIGVLLAAIAVPAMAAPDSNTHAPQVIRLLMPEAVPYNQEYAALVYADLTELSEGMAQTKAVTADSEPLLTPHPGPAARPFAGYLGHADSLKAEECLAMAIYYEAASEGLAGQQAVAQVVMNRVRHPAWPNSVCGVVFQGSERTTGCQFTFTCDGSLARKPNASGMARARAVARAALGGYAVSYT
ncbi:MAG: cell wall hydrolase, partial [Alteraurantiacibacter sp.]|nr:cell wall hydrolase [Alteraurantiacibacter sp.]